MAIVLKRQPSNSTSEDDDDDDDGVECPLSGPEALAACKEFASVTSTDTGLAMMMLQKNQWDLQRAINAYQNLTGGKSKSSRKQTETKNEKATIESDIKRIKTEESTTVSISKDAKTRFKLLSWNIDGLDEQENTIETRTRGVIDVIKREEPDAVFLQEVIPIAFDLIRNLLPEYNSHTGNTEGYFVIILTRRDLFQVTNFEIIPYPGTNMERNLLIVHTLYKNSIEIDLMTSHHESGTEELASKQRIEQLKLCFKYMIDAPSQRIVLFGGDLNIREKELQKLGNIPSGIFDLWIETGKRKECAYTWDMNRNSNVYYPSNNYQPRARFDRLYYRPSKENTTQFKPIYFELEGLEKLPTIKRYCSDHWAIQAYFDI